jgi:VWFA-related protein
MGRLTKCVCPRFVLLFLTALSAGSVRVQGQSANTPSVPAARPQTIEQPSTRNQIRVRANEVVAPVSVTDKTGEVVLDLSRNDFHVFDDGVEQTIVHCDLGGDPLAVALTIETSSHIRMMAPVIHSIGSIFTETVMALNGEAAVITYDETVDVPQSFTQDHDAVEKAISKAEFRASEMRLYDGMAKAVQLLKTQPSAYRRIMLVVGESQDYSSEAKLGQVLREAQLANIMIYAIGPSSTTADLRYGTEDQGGKKTFFQAPEAPSECVDDSTTARPAGTPTLRCSYPRSMARYARHERDK